MSSDDGISVDTAKSALCAKDAGNVTLSNQFLAYDSRRYRMK